jgi:cytochrome c peroxidase
MRLRGEIATLVTLLGGFVGVGAADTPQAAFYSNGFAPIPSVAAMAAVGRKLFFDAALSASGKVSCATCHSPAYAYGPPNGAAVQRGGADGHQPGVRAVPSLRYAQDTPPFTEHFFDDDGDDSIDQGPAGGRTWDGRAQSAHDQAVIPLLSPFEMANADAAAVVAKVAAAGYAGQLRATFGARLFDDPTSAFKAVLLALETYQQDAAEFYPYTSKYDAWLRREVALSAAELRGLALFNDPSRGNCARCHPSAIRDGRFPQFTDHGYAAVGAPRNPQIPANANPRYHDLGLCGPLRTDLADRPEYCGLFRTPTLRNVALRRAFFHNGVMHRLEDAVRFYAQRDTRPAAWYPHDARGRTQAYDDLPRAYQINLERGAPFDRQAGDPPDFDARDVADLVAFLTTLTDGFRVTAR